MTNKQKTIILISALVVVLVIIILTIVGISDPTPDADENIQVQNQNSAMVLGALESAPVILPNTKQVITLEDGAAEIASANGASATKVSLTSIAETKKVGDRTDVLAILDISYGGSGTYQYVALYEETATGLKAKSISLIGDRVEVTGISTDDIFGDDGEEYLVTVSYHDRAEGEPMSAEPTEPAEKYIVVENGVFNLAKTDPALVEQGKN